ADREEVVVVVHQLVRRRQPLAHHRPARANELRVRRIELRDERRNLRRRRCRRHSSTWESVLTMTGQQEASDHDPREWLPVSGGQYAIPATGYPLPATRDR